MLRNFSKCSEIKSKTLNANISETKTSEHLWDLSLERGTQNTKFWKIWPGVPLWGRTNSLEKQSPRSQPGWNKKLIAMTSVDVSETECMCVCVSVFMCVCVCGYVCAWVCIKLFSASVLYTDADPLRLKSCDLPLFQCLFIVKSSELLKQWLM